MTPITYTPIGFISSPYNEPYSAPRQPNADDRVHEAQIILTPHKNYEQGLDDLEGFDRIWIIAHFDRVNSWKPKILTPRDRVKRGVFATRSPHRPNPISVSAVELISIKGLTLTIRGIDLLDGTPILDIKPYVPYADAFPDCKAGWTDTLNESSYTVHISAEGEPLPTEIREHVMRVLSFDPTPHPYRRITDLGNERYEIAIKHWRCEFKVKDLEVFVDRVTLLST